MGLRDKVAIVTGGGRAIGKAIALRLAREGAHVTFTGLESDELNAAAGEISSLGGRGPRGR
jgi:NAD(P)-dependent dehydrogenase (short-subunit alcohol dehydrogenase family)